MPKQPIAEEYRGVRFRQVAPTLRWRVGADHWEYHESKRPRNPKTLAYTDGEDGTVIQFEDDAYVDVARMIAQRWIVRLDQRSHAARRPPAEPAVVGAEPETEAPGG
jgi:hypothetical protein